MEDKKYYSVTAINRYLYHKFDIDVNLQEVYVQGELSNFKWSGKHCYFSLKDANSELNAMFFYPGNLDLKFEPKDGISVQVIGKIQVYQKRGTYALVVSKMIEEGVGLLYQEYLDLKDKLAKEGLFDEKRKLPLPEYPENVAIITAPTGDAIHDIISTFNRRLPLAKLKLFPALVQGSEAPIDLIRALQKVYQDPTIEVLIIGRGGGSFEDLSCFNNEMLARTLASSPIPTVSAIGHEADFTICDFVSSYRAPTPTGAAMRLTKEKNDVIDTIINLARRSSSAIKKELIDKFNTYDRLRSSYGLAKFDEYLNNKNQEINVLDNRLALLSPNKIADRLNQTIEDYYKRMVLVTNHQYTLLNDKYNNLVVRLKKERIESLIEQERKEILNNETRLLKNLTLLIEKNNDKLKTLIEKCTLVNPFNIMLKGYSIVYKENKVIAKIKNIEINDEVKIKMADGYFKALVKERKEE